MPEPKKKEINLDEGTLLFVVAAIILLPLVLVGFFSQ